MKRPLESLPYYEPILSFDAPKRYPSGTTVDIGYASPTRDPECSTVCVLVTVAHPHHGEFDARFNGFLPALFGYRAVLDSFYGLACAKHKKYRVYGVTA